MPIAKPTTKSDWGNGNPDFANRVVEPSSAKKIAAWLDDERPPAPIANWLWYIHDQWIKYFESVTDESETRYDAIVGAGAASTHASLAAAVADVSLGTNKWIRVDDDFTVESVINLTKAGWRIDFRPGVTYTRGVGVPVNCLSLEADGISVNYGRFVGWTAGGNAAIIQTAAAVYNTVINSRFGIGTTLEVDQSAVPVGKKGPVANTITEV